MQHIDKFNIILMQENFLIEGTPGPWTILCGLETISSGLYHMAHDIWSISYGPHYMVHIIWLI